MLPDPDIEHVKHGGKVFMPPGALDKLTRLQVVEFFLSAHTAAVVYPIFEHILALLESFHREVRGTSDHIPMCM